MCSLNLNKIYNAYDIKRSFLRFYLLLCNKLEFFFFFNSHLASRFQTFILKNIVGIVIIEVITI